MSSKYERELRQALAGVEKGVEAIIRSCNPIEKEKMRLVIKRPFLVVRAAGSGMEGSGDLLALRGDMSFPIEVKSSKESKLYLSGRTTEQYNALKLEGERCRLMPLYAFRVKGTRGDSWRVFRVETSNLSGKLRKLSSSIPKLPRTRNNSPHLDWHQGMPLNEFIALVCSQSGEKERDLAMLKTRAQKNEHTRMSHSDSTKDWFDNQQNYDVLSELIKRRTN